MNLGCGGLTPSLGLVKQIAEKVLLPLVILLRPRTGDFVYSQEEVDCIRRDVDCFRSIPGVVGFAFGCLMPNGELDVQSTKTISDAIGKKQKVFHRAFDFATQPLQGLDQLISLGINRVMTSGQANTAFEGRDQLKEFQKHAQGAIEILPAGGIRAQDAKELVKYTGCKQLHVGMRRWITNSSINTALPLASSTTPSPQHFDDLDETALMQLAQTR